MDNKAYHILVENDNIHSWRKLNLSKILIDGIEYSFNGMANIVIIDVSTFEVIDSVVYDTH